MKYHQFSKRGQEDRSHLLANAFGGTLGMDLCTSVVNPLQEMITNIMGYEKLQVVFRIYKKPSDMVIKFSYTSYEAYIW
ncbi:hypothetical protein [Aquimarina longa]|uniref:hypothetical protein n=1 Tax=Aquimarina longa TaxID=1080221 RepID=UPI00078084B4|nr:hypothetical protein [Aquimarina longa]